MIMKMHAGPAPEDALAKEPPILREEAYNTEGFVEFLAEFPDAEAVENDQELFETRFLAFKHKAETATKLSSLFKTELVSQELGIEFGDGQLQKHIGGRIESLSRENPEKVNEVFEALDTSDKLRAQIAEAEQKIAELVAKGDLEKTRQEFEKKQKILEKAKETQDFFTGGGILGTPIAAFYEKLVFGKSADVEFAKKRLETVDTDPGARTKEELEAFVEAQSGSRDRLDALMSLRDYKVWPTSGSIDRALEQTKKDIEAVMAQMDMLEQLKVKHAEAKERFEQIRELLLAGVGTNKDLAEIAKKAAAQKLKRLMETDPDKAQSFFEDLREASDENSLDIDYLGNKEKRLQKQIEKLVDEKIAEDMKSIVEKTPFGPKAYDKLAKSLESFLSRQKVGTKEGDRARAFVVDTLVSIAKDLAVTDKSRALLLRLLIARVSQ